MNSPAKNVEDYLKDLPEWQGMKLSEFRKLIHEVAPEVIEEIKWGVPVFYIHNKMLLSMGAFKAHVKYNFILNGASLEDSNKLFNNGLDSKKSRSIDIRENESVDPENLKQLLQQSIKLS